jgi:hypothetical protein
MLSQIDSNLSTKPNGFTQSSADALAAIELGTRRALRRPADNFEGD